MAMRSPIKERPRLVEEPQRPITFEEYRELPEDGPRFELIYGELYMSPAPKPVHQFALGRLYALIDAFVMQQRLGVIAFAPFDVKISGHSGVQPDLLYFSVANKGAIGGDFAIKPPDLVVEVLSPSNRRMDLIVKRALYADFGVPEYWIVDPEKRTISVNLLNGAHYVDTTFAQAPIVSQSLSGIAIDFEAVFEMPEWSFGVMSANEDEGEDDD